MPDLLFSIIIPTYNRANFIEKAINSVLNQNYKNWELIIVDDGSTDNTEEIVSKFISDKIKYYKKENEERAIARNYGIDHSKGDFITFLDSDDFLYPHHLLNAIDFYHQNTQIEWFALGFEFRNENNEIVHEFKNQHGDLNQKLFFGNYLACCGVFVKKNIFDEVRFSVISDVVKSEDWLLWLQLSARKKLYFLNEVSCAMVEHSARSVNNDKEIDLLGRLNTVISVLNNDFIFQKKYPTQISVIEGHFLTYMSIHLLGTENKLLSIKYWMKGILKSPQEIFTRRTLAIIKHFIFTWK